MGRPSTYDRELILDTAGTLVRERGPAALTVAGVAQRMGAPTGSIYHRFRSRDEVAAALWLRAVERFQEACFIDLDRGDPRVAIRRSARRILAWTRDNPEDGGLLLLHRSRDLLDRGWPASLVQRNERQRARIADTISSLCDRLGATSVEARRRVTFAATDLPYGAVRSWLAAGDPPPPELDDIVDDAVGAVLDGITAEGGG